MINYLESLEGGSGLSFAAAQTAFQALSPQQQALGPIGPLLADPNVSEIMVMGARDVYVEVGGRILLTPIRFENDGELLRVIHAIVESVGQPRIAQGTLFIHPPVAVDEIGRAHV